MHAYEHAKEAMETIASNPKVAVTVSTATTAIGAAAAGDLIHGLLVNASMAAGIVVTILLGRVHWMKYKILAKQLDDIERGVNVKTDVKNE